MQNNYEILELFPTPIFTTLLPLEYSNIVPWFFKQPMAGDSEDGPKVDETNYGDRSKNSYILNEPECSDLSSYILELTKEYGRNLGYSYSKYRFSQSWLSFKHPGQHHTMHTHPNSLISGVLYFGENVKNIPAIKFHKMVGGINSSYISPMEVNNKKEHKYAWNEFSIEFTPGLLLLFPSFLHHSVPLNTTSTVRSSLAFNIVPEVGFGREENLTELIF